MNPTTPNSPNSTQPTRDELIEELLGIKIEEIKAKKEEDLSLPELIALMAHGLPKKSNEPKLTNCFDGLGL